MTRTQKHEIVENLTESFKTASAVIACDFRGLTVGDIESLRNQAKAINANVQVVKNTLASLAMKNAGIEGMVLNENNIFIWSDESIGASKAVFNFAKENDKFVIKLMVKFLMLHALKHLLNFQVAKNFLVCLLQYGWVLFVTLRLVLMHLELKTKQRRR